MKKSCVFLLAILLLTGLITTACQGYGKEDEDGSRATGDEEGKEMLPFNAIIMGNDGSLAYKEDFLRANRTYGVLYQNENGDGEEDFTSPKFRTFIITEKIQLDDIFSVCPVIDFEKEMVVMYAYTSVYGRERIIRSITLKNKNLKIEFKIAEGKPGYKDASVPQTRYLVLRMEKLDIDTAEFTLLNPRG